MHRSGYHRYRPAVSPNLERIFGMVQKRGLAPSQPSTTTQKTGSGEVPVPVFEPCRIFGLVHYFSHKATQTEPSGANCRSAVPVEHAEFPHKGPENW